MSGFPLTGVDPADPTPGLVRELRVAQGTSTGAGTSRDVCLVGNKLSAGSEAVDTLGTAILDEEDCITRFGQGSELHWMYKKFTAVPQSANVYAIAVTEGSGAASVGFTLLGTASGSTTLKVTVHGETVEVGVASGDAIGTIGAAAVAKINAQADWPVTAAYSTGVITLTAKNTGTRGDYIMARARMTFSKSATTTVTKGAVTGGGADDDMTNAITALQSANIYYQVLAKTTTSSASASDNGIGEHSAFINAMIQPTNGKEFVGIAALTGTQSQATTVATSVNNAFYFLPHAENNDWPASMIAAHYAAIKRSKEIAHPGANLTDYGTRSGDICLIPDPYTKSDRPTSTEIRADLNNGVIPISFTQTGQAFIVRDITSHSLNGSVNDYRSREGHIPSVMAYFWASVASAWSSFAQSFVADDPVEGQKPLKNTTYPRDAKALVAQIIDEMISNTGGPILDPSYQDLMKSSIEAVRLTDGISVRVPLFAVKHNNKGQFLIEESSVGY